MFSLLQCNNDSGGCQSKRRTFNVSNLRTFGFTAVCGDAPQMRAFAVRKRPTCASPLCYDLCCAAAQHKKPAFFNSYWKRFRNWRAGALYWLAMGVLGLIIEGKTLALCYLLGVGSIFPLGLLLGRLLKADLMSRNPLGALSGIVGGIQAFFLPLWIVIYIEHFELIPFAIGLLAGSHFLPYIWIYRSRTYLFLTLSMAAESRQAAQQPS